MGEAAQKRIWNVRKRKQKHKHRTAVLGNQSADEVSKALALMLLVYTLLTTLNLKCDMSALPLKKQNEEHCAKIIKSREQDKCGRSTFVECVLEKIITDNADTGRLAATTKQ